MITPSQEFDAVVAPLDVPDSTRKQVAPRCRIYHAWTHWRVDRATVSVGTALFGSGPLALPAIRNIRECTRCGLTQIKAAS